MVITCGKLHQIAPVFRQQWLVFKDLFYRQNFAGVNIRLDVVRPYNADLRLAAQFHDDAATVWEFGGVGISEQGENGVERDVVVNHRMQPEK